jgi:hypothetical protein
MESKDFLSPSIKDIIDCVIDALKYATGKGALANVYEQNSHRNIEYNIA